MRRLLHENVWALADQALISATNFATVVILARALAPRDFGVFVLAYTALLFVNGLQTALITQPHNVLGQGRTGDDYRRYTRSSAVGQGLFSLAAALVALAVALAAYAAGLSSADVLFAAVPALVAWQLQEFARHVLYTENRLRTAFAIDVVGYGGQVVLILALVAADRASGANALYAVAVASSAGALVGAWAIRASLRGRVERSYLAENWAFGKWLGAAIAASWLSGSLFFYLTAVVVNAGATAGLKASQTVLGPLNAFLLFIVTILPIRLAAARERDEPVGVGLRLAYLASAPFVWAYCALVAVFARADPRHAVRRGVRGLRGRGPALRRLLRRDPCGVRPVVRAERDAPHAPALHREPPRRARRPRRRLAADRQMGGERRGRGDDPHARSSSRSPSGTPTAGRSSRTRWRARRSARIPPSSSSS